MKLLTWFGRGLCESCPNPVLDTNRDEPLFLKICVVESGEVAPTDASSLEPELAAVVKVVQGWRFRPFLVDGVPQAFCFLERFR